MTFKFDKFILFFFSSLVHFTFVDLFQNHLTINDHKVTPFQLWALNNKRTESYVCQSCGFVHIKWVGKCTSCQEWNSVIAQRQSISSTPLSRHLGVKVMSNLNSGLENKGWLVDGGTNNSIVKLESINASPTSSRLKLFSGEMDRVLGGGLTKGSVVLFSGEPGVGKSTLLLQLASDIGKKFNGAVYISGEENAEQIASRANRLSLSLKNLYLICETDSEFCIEKVLEMDSMPNLLIVDSIQTMRILSGGDGSAGGVTQTRENTARFVQLAKSTGISVLLVGHVTKSGDVGGPKVLEHMVDTVLSMEGSDNSDYRFVRCNKNRFGAATEVAVFSMSENGMEDVLNPSELFISNQILIHGSEGSAATVVLEGSRAISAEIQCLVGITSPYPKFNPKRTSDGFPVSRLLLICAVIEKHLKVTLSSRDVFVNVISGMKLSEPSADLALCIAIISSLTSAPVRPGVAFIGEIGLGGEIRGARSMETRVNEASKIGFQSVVIPSISDFTNKNHNKKVITNNIKIIPCKTLKDALSVAFDGDIHSLLLQTKRKNSKAMLEEDEYSYE
eukprot:gene8936-12051_t